MPKSRIVKMLYVDGVMDFSCYVCGYKTRSETGGKLHMRVSHSMDAAQKPPSTAECAHQRQVCEEKFGTPSEFKDHARRTGHISNRSR